MLFCTVVIALCIFGAHSAPNKACAPNQWSGTMLGTIGQMVGNTTMVMESRAMVATDYTKKFESFMQNVSYNGKIYQRHQISDFGKGKTYDIDPVAKKCKVTDISGRSLKQYCVGDPDLKVATTMTIGGKQANVYEMEFANTTAYFTVAVDDFSPITIVIEQNFHGVPQLLAYQYGNVTELIPDLSVFDIPSYCSSEVKTTKRICAPEQYEVGAAGRLAQVNQGKVENIGLGMRVSYDFKNKVEATATDIYMGDSTTQSVSITHWKEQMTYVIDPKAKTCIAQPTPIDTMIEMCNDSENLTAIAAFDVDGKQADMYRLKVEGNIHETFTVFRDNFELVSAVIEQKFVGIPQMLAFQFGNMTTGISDPTVFDLPDYCKKNSADLVG